MGYQINTGQFEKGTQEQKAVFIQLLGAENTQYKFDLYFHWYNIIHEYGHCLCSYHESNIIGLKQEFLVNRFAVSIWQYAGYDKELEELQDMLCEILQRIENPVPDHMSFSDYYEQIWETEEIRQVPIYGYFQFKSVQMALENREDLAAVLGEMGIHKEISSRLLCHKNYSFSAQTAKEALYDIRQLLDSLGIEQPTVDVELVDDPSVQCVNYIDSPDWKMFGMLPPYATDMDYNRCEKIVRGILDCEEGVNVQELTLKVMNISYAKGGGYSSDTITAFAKSYISELAAQR